MRLKIRHPSAYYLSLIVRCRPRCAPPTTRAKAAKRRQHVKMLRHLRAHNRWVTRLVNRWTKPLSEMVNVQCVVG